MDVNASVAPYVWPCMMFLLTAYMIVKFVLVVLLPGNVRNDFYVTLLQGEFDRGKKKTPKNVEVILSVHNDEGNPMEVKEKLS